MKVMLMRKKEVEYACRRCGYRWAPRVYIESKPSVCPKCKSVYWDKKRKLHYDWHAKHRKLVKV